MQQSSYIGPNTEIVPAEHANTDIGAAEHANTDIGAAEHDSVASGVEGVIGNRVGSFKIDQYDMEMQTKSNESVSQPSKPDNEAKRSQAERRVSDYFAQPLTDNPTQARDRNLSNIKPLPLEENISFISSDIKKKRVRTTKASQKVTSMVVLKV